MVLGIFALRYRRTATGKAFLLLILCGWIWTTGFIFEIAALDLNTKMATAAIQFIGITFLPAAQLNLAVTFLGKQRSKRVWILLLVIPVLTNLIIWTNPLHHWFWGTPEIIRGISPFPVLQADYRFWFYAIHAPYGYLYTLAALVILVRGMHSLQAVHRTQAILVLSAALIPAVTDLFYIFDLTPVPYFNFTPAVFSISGVLIAVALFRFHFLDLLPLARDHVFENMTEGVIVLDDNRRIVDLNRAALEILGTLTPPIGRPITAIQGDLSRHIETLFRERKTQADFESGELIRKNYDMRIAVVQDRRGRAIGQVITLRDITERMRLYHNLHDLAIRDSLTCALNRRHFMDLGREEILHVHHDSDRSLAVIMIDVDGFKHVNDTFGHAAGDKVLIELAQDIQRQLRENDLFGRIGGDEFAIFLPNVTAEVAQRIARRISQGIEALRFSFIPQEIRISACLGVFTSKQSGPNMDIDTMLNEADIALYQAKRSGPGQVVLVCAQRQE
jgi:diguanylate cyclase (GGDEF)-like protein/PAS domain S-box-containing protein